MRASHFVVLFLLVPMTWGCSDGDAGGPGTPPGNQPNDTTDPAQFKDTKTGTTPADGDKIDFVMVNGDDGQPCKGTDRCSIWMSYLGDRQLKIISTRNNIPIENLILDWKIVTNPNNSLKLQAQQTFTNNQGLAENLVNQTASQNGNYTVRVSINGSTAQPLFFDVAVSAKGQVPLTVHYLYSGTRNFDGITTYLFKQDAQNQFLCKDMVANNLPTAVLAKGPTILNQSVQFASLPGLGQEGSQKYTIVGVGKNVNGPPLVVGCNSTHATVTLQGTVKVIIELDDLPPIWKGKYDVTTEFDLVSVFPENVEKVVNVIVGLFQDPAAQLLILACYVGGDTLEALCGFMFKDPASIELGSTLDDSDFKSVGLTVKELINNLLKELLKDTTAGGVLQSGEDISNILKRLRFSATLEFINEPKADGTFTVEDTSEEWHTVRYKWTLGSGCEPNDDSCGWRNVSFQAWNNGKTVEGKFAGKVDYSTENFLLTIDSHPLNIKYGALLLYVIEKEILPLLFNDPNDTDAPKIDSLEKMVKSLMGGKKCLFKDTCCEDFADDVTDQATGFTKALAEAACDALVSVGIEEIKKLLVAQDVDTDGAFTIGTLDPCMCLDLSQNMYIDAWGSQTKPCVWDAKLTLPNYTQQIENKFWATKLD